LQAQETRQLQFRSTNRSQFGNERFYGFWGANKTSTEKTMNWKKLFIAFIAAFVFIFLFEWLLHGVFFSYSLSCSQLSARCGKATCAKHFERLWRSLNHSDPGAHYSVA
jgi:hypothetical protein